MSTIKVSVSRGDRNISVEGDRETVRDELQRYAGMLGLFDDSVAAHGDEAAKMSVEANSFAEFYDKSHPKRGTQGLIAAKYLADVKSQAELKIQDLNRLLEEAGRPKLSMPSRANLVRKGWLERLGRGRFALTDVGRKAYESLVGGESLRGLPVGESKKQKVKRGGPLAKYQHELKPTNIIACLLKEMGPLSHDDLLKNYEKAIGQPPANLKLLLRNMTSEKIGTADLVGENYQLTKKGQAAVKEMEA